MSLERLAALRLSQLKHAAFLVGLPSTGTKAELASGLSSRLADEMSIRSHRRILSVDMGIRNLAYCVVDVPVANTRKLRGNAQSLTVSTWRKLDLLQGSGVTRSDVQDSSLKTAAKLGRRGRKQPTATVKPAANAFTPSALSRTAYDVTLQLLTHKPDTILIERQRFRSGGASAIQEWTVRVNMLESMLWACLHTMSQFRGSTADGSPSVHEVSPARVANFWTAPAGLGLRFSGSMLEPGSHLGGAVTAEKPSRRKVQKKDKVAIVRSWLKGSAEFSLEAAGEAAAVASAFDGNRRDAETTANGEADPRGGKLDDLADCVLQAAAWARWEDNTLLMRSLLSS